MKEYKVWVRLQLEECDHENDEYRNICVEDGVIYESDVSEEILLYTDTEPGDAQEFLNSIADLLREKIL